MTSMDLSIYWNAYNGIHYLILRAIRGRRRLGTPRP